MKRKLTAALTMLCLTPCLRADVKLPAIFGDHMVLQREAKVPVWGTADAGEAVTVTAGDSKATATADGEGKWKAELSGLKASATPMDVVIAGKNRVTLHDVLVGDVWVCSGQSNMEFQLGGGKYGFGGASTAATEIPKAEHPTMRLFIVTKKVSLEPLGDCVGSWKVCTPDSAARFSAVGYFFGKEILEEQQIPVGMIGTYWGGTPAQSWTSMDGLKSAPELAKLVNMFLDVKDHLPQKREIYEKKLVPAWQKANAAWQLQYGAPYEVAMKKWRAEVAAAAAAGQPAPTRPPAPEKPAPRKPSAPDNDAWLPSVLNNGMIHPLIPFAIKGAIWYQGESDAGNPKLYQTLFPAMITDWRTQWGEGDFPFLFVQLANFQARLTEPTQSSGAWAGLREAQSMTLKLPNTGDAVIDDIGQADDIHPKDKADVGHRLALAARHVAYGEDLVYSGPTYDSMQVEGDKIRIKFKNLGSGLTIAAAPSTQPGVPAGEPASELKGFSIAGADQKFVWASAVIDGESVVVGSPDVKEPVAVRYGWANNPEVNLYNKEKLPASPFRTDDWDDKKLSKVPVKQ